MRAIRIYTNARERARNHVIIQLLTTDRRRHTYTYRQDDDDDDDDRLGSAAFRTRYPRCEQATLARLDPALLAECLLSVRCCCCCCCCTAYTIILSSLRIYYTDTHTHTQTLSVLYIDVYNARRRAIAYMYIKKSATL